MPSWLDDWLNPSVQAALVAAAVAAGGWVHNGRQNRLAAARQRSERVADVQRAILAEIRAHVVALENQQTTDAWRRDMVARVRQGGYVPTLPSEANDRIFRAIISEVHLLPAGVIDPVVIYYRLLAVMAFLAANLAALAAQDAARAADMLEDYLSLADEVLDSGRFAMLILSASLDGGDAAVDAMLHAGDRTQQDMLEAEVAALAQNLPRELQEMRERLNRRSSDRSGL